MKRAKAQVIGSTSLKWDKFLDNINYLSGTEDTFYCGTVNHGVNIFRKTGNGNAGR